MGLVRSIAVLCVGFLIVGGGGALAVNYRGFAVTFARRAEQSARSVWTARRLPHPMDRHDRIVFARVVGGLMALVGMLVMASEIPGILELMDVSYGLSRR